MKGGGMAHRMLETMRAGFGSGLVAALVVGCGGGNTGRGAAAPSGVPPAERSGEVTQSGDVVSKRAADEYREALKAFVQHDAQHDWDAGACQAAAERFTAVAKLQSEQVGKPLPEALYNAGLARLRCGDEAAAREHFRAASSADGSFHRAKAQMTLFDFSKDQDLDRAVAKLEKIIRDAKFQDVEALVSVAALQMERNNDVSDSDGKNDFDRAKKNIQRALAIDDGFMPAMNQLAIYYLEAAKHSTTSKRGRRKLGLVVSGSRRQRANQQRLELARLTAQQGISKNPNYAPLHNTAGLIQVEMRKYNSAVKEFDRARKLDPAFFEAHMNYGAVSLSFRGFSEADAAYREALRLEPKDYEAHLGLALALRGQINDGNSETYLAEAKKHLATCKSLQPRRAEAYYNEAILTQEYEAKGVDASKAIPALQSAAAKYTEFVQRAEGDRRYSEAVKRSKERAQEIRDTISFIKEGEALQREQEEIERKTKAVEGNSSQSLASPPPQASKS